MTNVSIDRLMIQTQGNDPAEAQRLARCVAQLLGEGMAGGAEVRPRREAIIDIQAPAGLGGDLLAEYVAREIRRQLG